MKIIYLGRYNDSETLTGPEKVAKRIFLHASKKNKCVFIEYFFDGRKYSYFKKLFGNERASNADNRNVLRLGIIPLFFYLVKQKPEIIHIITYERFAGVAFLYKLLTNVKIVFTIHGICTHENSEYKNVSSFYKLRDKFFENIFLRYSDKLVFLSEGSVTIAERYFHIDKNKIEMLPNGIDEIFNAVGNNRKHYNETGILRIVFAGNIDRKEKGFEFLNKALGKVKFPFRLFIISDKKNIENENYIFVSKMDSNNFARFLADKDVFISASEYEPFSIAAVESMAAGLVPVVTKQTGMSRFIKNNYNGMVTDHGNEENLVQILNALNSDRTLLAQLSKNAGHVYEELNWEKVFDKYDRLYLTLLNS